MTTTIQISEETKKKLFQVINRLEKKLNRRVTYNEAIEFLLKEQKVDVDKEKFLENIKKFQGIFKYGEGQALLKELRREDREREKRLVNRFNNN